MDWAVLTAYAMMTAQPGKQYVNKHPTQQGEKQGILRWRMEGSKNVGVGDIA